MILIETVIQGCQLPGHLVIEMMARLPCVIVAGQSTAAERQIANDVQELVAGAFIWPPQRVVFDANGMKNEQIVGRGPASIPHRLQARDLRREDKCAGPGDLTNEDFGCDRRKSGLRADR